MESGILLAIVGLVAVVAGAAVGYVMRQRAVVDPVKVADIAAAHLRSEAETRAKELVLQAQDEAVRLRTTAEEQHRGRRAEIQQQEKRLQEKEEQLDRKLEDLDRRDRAYQAREREIDAREREADQLRSTQATELEKLSGLTMDAAREVIVTQVEADVRELCARRTREIEDEAGEEAERAARRIVSTAIQRYASDQISESTVSIVHIPNEEMKGRIIGREGRNIRALEAATGIDLIVDDTPDAVTLSGFDPIRREIARLALTRLVTDGRIHPARIEEVVDKTRQEVDEESRERGERVCFELGLAGVHDRLILLLGRLDFMRDHGQNLLHRGREVAQLSGAIADELRVASDTLRRAGLLHEVARAEQTPLLTHWAIASADLATRFGEKPAVAATIRALASPPDAPRTPEGVILSTARRLSLSRPGARNENLQRFMDRQQEIEALALARDGVEIAVAVRAGRELRVHLRADAVPDDGAHLMARELARAIEKRVDYPGQVRVTVIRETRAVSFAV